MRFRGQLLLQHLVDGAVEATGESPVADAIATLSQHISMFDLRHAGLALSTSIAATVNLVLLAMLLRRRLGALGIGELLPSFIRALAASAAMIPAVRYVAGFADWTHRGLIIHFTVLFAAIASGVVVFVAVALLLGGDEVRSVIRLIRERLARPVLARSRNTATPTEAAKGESEPTGDDDSPPYQGGAAGSC